MKNHKQSVAKFFLGIFLSVCLFFTYQNCGGGKLYVKSAPQVVSARVGCEQMENMVLVGVVNPVIANPTELITYELPNRDTIATLLVDFGDNTTCDAFDAEASKGICEVVIKDNRIIMTHSYQNPGNYMVKFQAVDSCYFGKVDFKNVCIRKDQADTCSPAQ